MTYDVFISYSSKDKRTAEAACAALEASGVRCWMAPRDVRTGMIWAEAIIGGINACRAMVLVFSSHSNVSVQVIREAERAASAGKPLIPFRIEDVTPAGAMEYFLSSSQWLDALGGDFAAHLSALVQAARVALAGKAPPAKSPPPEEKARAGAGLGPGGIVARALEIRGRIAHGREAGAGGSREPDPSDEPDRGREAAAGERGGALALQLKGLREAEARKRAERDRAAWEKVAGELRKHKEEQEARRRRADEEFARLAAALGEQLGGGAWDEAGPTLARLLRMRPADAELLEARAFLSEQSGLPPAAELACLVGHGGGVRAACFSPDGRLVLSGGEDQTLRVWDVETACEVRALEGHEGPVAAAAFSPDGRRVLSAASDGTARLWDAATGEPLGVFPAPGRGAGGPPAGWPPAIAFAPDGRLALSADPRPAPGGAEEPAGLAEGSGATGAGGALPNAFGPVLRLWELESGRVLTRFEGHGDEVTAAAFTPDGLLALSGANDRTLRLWDAGTGRQVRAFSAPRGAVSAVALSADGRFALGAQDRAFYLWDVATGRRLQRFRADSGRATAVAFSPDGSRALSGSGGLLASNALTLWDLRPFLDPAEPRDAAAGPPAPPVPAARFEGHADYVSAVCFSPDGALALSASGDGTVRIWLARE